jgi:hypothetical protein
VHALVAKIALAERIAFARRIALAKEAAQEIVLKPAPANAELLPPMLLHAAREWTCPAAEAATSRFFRYTGISRNAGLVYPVFESQVCNRGEFCSPRFCIQENQHIKIDSVKFRYS